MTSYFLLTCIAKLWPQRVFEGGIYFAQRLKLCGVYSRKYGTHLVVTSRDLDVTSRDLDVTSRDLDVTSRVLDVCSSHTAPVADAGPLITGLDWNLNSFTL